MRSVGGHIELSAAHRTQLDLAVAMGKATVPKLWDPLLQIHWERDLAHEQSYIEHLEGAGFEVVRIEGVGIERKQLTETGNAMRAGVPIIVQGALAPCSWSAQRAAARAPSRVCSERFLVR